MLRQRFLGHRPSRQRKKGADPQPLHRPPPRAHRTARPTPLSGRGYSGLLLCMSFRSSWRFLWKQNLTHARRSSCIIWPSRGRSYLLPNERISSPRRWARATARLSRVSSAVNHLPGEFIWRKGRQMAHPPRRVRNSTIRGNQTRWCGRRRCNGHCDPQVPAGGAK